MSQSEQRLREVLSKIAQLISEVNNSDGKSELQDKVRESKEASSDEYSEVFMNICTPKALPSRLLIKAADTAIRINPTNAPVVMPLAKGTEGFQLSEPQRIAALTSKYWGPTPRMLTVSFIESTPADLRARIITHMRAWNQTTCISFMETNGIGDIRISRGEGGFWSYLGTDLLHIPKGRPTMNLEGFTMTTPESEYKRVVRHETGHTLGFPHEHMRRALVARIDPFKAYAWFKEVYGWDKATVDAQVLTPLDDGSLMATPPDQTSIMAYQLPGDIMRDGKPILGGIDINESDYMFAGKIYPKLAHTSINLHEDDWEYSDDPEDPS